MARGLNNTQKMDVQNRILEQQSVDKIIKETGYPEKLIKEYLERLEDSLVKVKSKGADAEDNPSVSADNLFKKVTNNNRKGVMMQTQASSMRVDENRNKANKISQKLQDCTRPLRKEENF